ncbi:reverse transcriptase domain-containing protein [Tanacetum coccineum]
MPPTMMTQSVVRSAVASRGGGTGGRVGSGSGRTRGSSGDQGDVPDFSTIITQQLQNLLLTIVAQVGNQGRGQGVGRNQNGDAVNDYIRGDVGNATEGNDRRGYTYKEFLACNPKEYDGKGGVIVYTRWIKKMESVHDMSGCRNSPKVKYTTGLFVCKALTWWNSEIHTRGREATIVEAGHVAYIDRFHELARLVPHLVTPKGKKIERREPNKDMNGKKDNKRTRMGNAFSITTNPVSRGYTGTEPKCTACGYHHLPETPCRSCFNCNRPGHFAKDCRLVPRNVNLINTRNPVARTCYECGSTDHIKSACPRLN